MRKPTMQKFFLVIGSVVFGLAGIELLGWIGVVDYRALFSPPSNFFVASNLFDPELIHIHPPHLHFTGSVRGGDIMGVYRIPKSDMTNVKLDLHYDRNGFRNKTDLSSADTIVIGDSFVEAVATPDEELLSSRLAKIRGVQVANLGQNDYGPVEELAVLRRYGLPLRPQTVVWMFFEGNDLVDVARFQKGGYRDRTSHADPKPAQGWSFRNTMEQARQRSFLQNALTRIKGEFKPSGRLRAGVMQSHGQSRTVYFRHPGKPYSSRDLKALDETADILASAEKLSAASGSRFLFVFIPIKFRALRESCNFFQESECRTWVLNDMPERLRKAVGPVSSGVGYLDLTPYFAAAARSGVLAYFTDDDHWSSEGQSIAAEAIDKYIASMPGLPLSK